MTIDITTPPGPPGTGPPRGAGGAGEPAAVSLRDVSVTFGKHRVVRDVTLDLVRNRVTALVGPSGCGKTTILRTVNRLHDDTGGKVSGQVLVGDLDVYARDTQAELVRSRVGMVFQRPNPFPTMSIFDNVVAGLAPQRGPLQERPARGRRGRPAPRRAVGPRQGPAALARP